MTAKPRPGHTTPELAQLTDREHDVFEHLAAGLSNADIARAMFVSEVTVKTHINRLFTKLGVRDRVQAGSSPTNPDSSHPGPRLSNSR